jgi:hypothetical protein
MDTNSPVNSPRFTSGKFYVRRSDRITTVILIGAWSGAATILLAFLFSGLYFIFRVGDINYIPIIIVAIFGFIIFTTMFFPFRIGKIILCNDRLCFVRTHPLLFLRDKTELRLTAISDIRFDAIQKRLSVTSNNRRQEIILKGAPSVDLHRIVEIITKESAIPP